MRSCIPRYASDGALSAIEIAREMLDQVARVVFGAVDEGRLAAPEHRQSDRIQPGRIDDAAVVPQVALAIDDRHVEPAVVGAKAGRPDDRPDLAAREVEIEP